MTSIGHTNNVINLIREKTNEVILFYSCGKDSIILLDLLCKKFDRVVCVFMYFVKDLEHINKYINYCTTKYNNVEVLQVPHFMLSSIYRYGMYCPVDKSIKKLLTLKDIDAFVRGKFNIYYTVYGWKQADSLDRRVILRTYKMQAFNEATNKVYPLSMWLDGQVLSYIKLNKLANPIRYSKNKSGGLGFNTECYVYLRRYYPNDLKKILKKFPLSQQILIQYDNKVSNNNRRDTTDSDQKCTVQSKKDK